MIKLLIDSKNSAHMATVLFAILTIAECFLEVKNPNPNEDENLILNVTSKGLDLQKRHIDLDIFESISVIDVQHKTEFLIPLEDIISMKLDINEDVTNVDFLMEAVK